jgi:hypothetical protein
MTQEERTKNGMKILANPIKILSYRLNEDEWCAVAIDMNIRGYGDSREASQEDLHELIESHVAFACAHQQMHLLCHPAEKQIFDWYNEALERSNNNGHGSDRKGMRVGVSSCNVTYQTVAA